MTRATRVTLSLLGFLGFLILTPTPAEAGVLGFGDCKDAPIAESPQNADAGFFAMKPDPIPQDPKDGAWVDGHPMYANYGTAGYTFHTYDLGCTPGIGDGYNMARNGLSNDLFSIPKMGVAGALDMKHAAYHPTYLQVLNKPLIDVTQQLRTTVFDEWAKVAVAGAGLFLLMFLHKHGASTVLTYGVWAVAVMALAFTIFQWPVRSGAVADNTLTQVTGAIDAGVAGVAVNGDPGAASADAVSTAVLFRQWKRGTFCSDDSAVANKYAKAIYTNQALTWAENEVVTNDPNGAGKKLREAKAKAWQDAAAKVKDEDPDAYECLKGTRSRMTAVGISWGAALAVLPLVVIGSLMMIASFLLIRLCVMFSPLIAVIAIPYPTRAAAVDTLKICVAACLNTVMFAVGTSVILLLSIVLLTPSPLMPLWLGFTLMTAVTGIIMFGLWKVATRMTKMHKPGDLLTGSFDQMTSATTGAAKGAMAMTASAVTGGAAGAAAGAMAAGRWLRKDTGGDVMDEARSEEVEPEETVQPHPEATPPPVALGAAPVAAPPPLALPAEPSPSPEREYDDEARHGPAWPMPGAATAPQDGQQPSDDTRAPVPPVDARVGAEAPYTPAVEAPTPREATGDLAEPLDTVYDADTDTYVVPEVDYGDADLFTPPAAAATTPDEGPEPRSEVQ